MTFTNIDRIVRSVLQQLQLPIHYYVQIAKHVVDGVREFKKYANIVPVSCKMLPVNAYHAFETPCDFVDWVLVGLPDGQFVRPLVQRSGISSLNAQDSSGAKVDFGSATGGYGGITNILDTNMNDHGESIGKLFGIRQGEQGDTFKLVRERGEFQLHQSITATEVYLEYISSGEGALEDTATKVDWRAQGALERYAKWQFALQNRNRSATERREEERLFGAAIRNLVAELSDYTLEDIQRIVRDAYTGTIKH